MNTSPEFDFQLSKNIRLRGWGWKGLSGLLLLLGATTIAFLALHPGIFSGVGMAARWITRAG